VIKKFVTRGVTEEPLQQKKKRGQLAVEPLIQGMTDLTISNRPTTPYYRADPPSPTPDTIKSNLNGLGSGSSQRISPLDNRVIHRVIQCDIPPLGKDS
jgi:hypothetical protein